MRFFFRAVGLLLLVVVLGLGAFLGEAHWEIRGINPDLPTKVDIETALATDQGPVQIRYINTASQGGGGRDVIHPSYAIEWPDGRMFLVDIGMDHEGAIAFGEPMEAVLGADPILPHGSVAELLWADVPRVQAIAFTHLHIDHAGGLAALCKAIDHSATVFQTDYQAEKGNYTTSPGQSVINDATCAKVTKLSGGPMYQFPDYPGLIAVAAGGHTPGSTIFFVEVAETVWVLSGDIALSLDDIRTNTAKPGIYSALIVPEAPARMDELRRWLSAFDEHGYRVIVSHDPNSLEENEMPRY